MLFDCGFFHSVHILYAGHYWDVGDLRGSVIVKTLSLGEDQGPQGSTIRIDP